MSKRALTKGQIVFAKVFWLLFMVVICSIFVLGTLMSGANDESIMFFVGILVIGTLIVAMTTYTTVTKTLNFIKKQECFLGISFNDEMRKYNFTDIGFHNASWYVARWERKQEVLVLHSDFIKYVSEMYYIRSGANHRYGREPDQWGITVIYADGSDRKFESSYEVLRDLESWLQRAAGSAEETKEDTKKVSTAKKQKRKPVRCIGCRAIVSSSQKFCPYCRSPLE